MRTRTAPPALWPDLGRERTLYRHGCGDRLRSAGEHRKERVTLRINLVALVRGKDGPQQGGAFGDSSSASVG